MVLEFSGVLGDSSPKKQLRNQHNKLCYDNLDPKSLYPLRHDHTYLLESRPFTFLIILWHNKISFHSFYFLRSVLLYVGQTYYENND
ncbi:hypothetical protein AMECASPLE_011532, partial [Ameca splendens]